MRPIAVPLAALRAARQPPTHTLYRDRRQRSESVALEGPGPGRRIVAGVVRGHLRASGQTGQPMSPPPSPIVTRARGRGYGEERVWVATVAVRPGGYAGGTPISDSRPDNREGSRLAY